MNSMSMLRRVRWGLVAVFAALISSPMQASAYVLIDPPNAWGKPDLPVDWHLNQTINDPSITNEYQIIRESFLVWSAVAGVDLSFLEGAASTFCGLAQNQQNHVSVEDCNNQCTGGCLAVTSTVLFATGDGFWNSNTVADTLLLARQESDITYNKTTNWGDSQTWTPCAGEFDMRGVSVHEMGHFIGLGHSATAAATMFASVAVCDGSKASLHADDNRGARVLYRNGDEIAVTSLTAGNATLGVTNKGNLGYTGPGGKWGASFQWTPLGAAEHLFECAFGVGSVGGAVSDNFRGDAITGGDADLQQASVLTVSAPGPLTDEQAEATFDDSRAESPYGLTIITRAYAENSAPNDDFVITEYVLVNTSGGALSNVRAGLFADVDFNNEYAQNSVNYDAANSLAYVSTPNTAALFGIAVLNSEGAAAMRALFATSTNAGENFTDANKQTWWSAGFERTTLGPADIALMINTGDFDIAPGDSAFAAFALLGGSNLADLQANAAAARDLYLNTISGGTTAVGDGRVVLPLAELAASRPNPFTSSTRMEWTVLTPGRVTVEVIDAGGRVVSTVFDGVQAKGLHGMNWDGTNGHGDRLPSGVYFSRLRTADGNQTRKVILTR